MKKSNKPAVFILNHDGFWEFNTLSKPIIRNYDRPVMLLVDHYDGKIKPQELQESKIKIKNTLTFGEKLSFIKEILFSKFLEIGTGLLLGNDYNKTKLY